MHSKFLIHRDVKPDNFLVGAGDKANILHVIDFGLTKQFRDKTGKHIPFKRGKSLTGTARYASLNTHLGEEQSRRDDLEAIGLVMVYFTQGSLPWQGLAVKTKKEKYEKIKQLKMSIKIETLCKNCPPEFSIFLNYCRKLRFEDDPDYAFLRKTVQDALTRQGYEYDNIFDWMIQKNKQKKDAITTSSPKIEPQTNQGDKEEIKEIKKQEDKHISQFQQINPGSSSHVIKENKIESQPTPSLIKPPEPTAYLPNI